MALNVGELAIIKWALPRYSFTFTISIRGTCSRRLCLLNVGIHFQVLLVLQHQRQSIVQLVLQVPAMRRKITFGLLQSLNRLVASLTGADLGRYVDGRLQVLLPFLKMIFTIARGTIITRFNLIRGTRSTWTDGTRVYTIPTTPAV